MLKKAGIVLATATAGLLAVAPLAFAQGNGDSENGSGPGYSSIDYFGIDSENDGAACEIGAYTGADNTQEGGGYVLALVGAAAGTLTQALTPATTAAQTIAPAASCNDLTFADNSQDNDVTVEGEFGD